MEKNGIFSIFWGNDSVAGDSIPSKSEIWKSRLHIPLFFEKIRRTEFNFIFVDQGSCYDEKPNFI